jgi:hypothetical protein
MDDKTSLLLATVAMVVIIPIVVITAYLVRDQLQARRNRLYKTLAEHEILNSSGDRQAWMTGVIPQEEGEHVDRFATRIAPILQLMLLLALVVVLLRWNGSLAEEGRQREERLSQLELQVHALAIAIPSQAVGVPRDGDPASGQPVAAPNVNPMQQACANLIGRVADAYEKGESSKIAESLEQLVNKLGCKNNPTP